MGDIGGGLGKPAGEELPADGLHSSEEEEEEDSDLFAEGLLPGFTDLADSSDGGLLTNLLGIVAKILIPFLGSLQELLTNLANALIGGLVSTLKTLLEEVIDPPATI